MNLEELSHSDYKVSEGQANINGWPVEDTRGKALGKVRDLLFDPAENAIRYIIVDLADEISGEKDKAVLFPIGYVELAQGSKKIFLLDIEQIRYVALPRYIIGEVTRETETKIRSLLVSSSTSSSEGQPVEAVHSIFYKHHHFDRGHLLTNGAETEVEVNLDQIANDTRMEERSTIHELIENAHQSGDSLSHASKDTARKFEGFNVTLHNEVFRIDPQENGTYRVFQREEKIGVIYAEPGERGVEWKTMDELEDRLVEVLGEAITAHHRTYG